MAIVIITLILYMRTLSGGRDLPKATWLVMDEAQVCHLSTIGMDDAGGRVNQRKEEGGHEAMAYFADSWVTTHCPILEHVSVTQRVNRPIPCE